MSYETNPYYSPEAHGLKPVYEFELTEPFYSFDTVCVWHHEDSNKFYWAHDTGCSCPVPFEDYNSLSDLTELRSVEDFRQAVKAISYIDDHSYFTQDLQQCCKLLRNAGVAG